MPHLEPDLHAAAFLLTKGFPLIRLERVGRRFAFELSPEAHEAAQEYCQGGTVVARDFARALRQLKDSLYAANTGRRGVVRLASISQSEHTHNAKHFQH